MPELSFRMVINDIIRSIIAFGIFIVFSLYLLFGHRNEFKRTLHVLGIWMTISMIIWFLAGETYNNYIVRIVFFDILATSVFSAAAVIAYTSNRAASVVTSQMENPPDNLKSIYMFSTIAIVTLDFIILIIALVSDNTMLLGVRLLLLCVFVTGMMLNSLINSIKMNIEVSQLMKQAHHIKTETMDYNQTFEDPTPGLIASARRLAYQNTYVMILALITSMLLLFEAIESLQSSKKISESLKGSDYSILDDITRYIAVMFVSFFAYWSRVELRLPSCCQLNGPNLTLKPAKRTKSTNKKNYIVRDEKGTLCVVHNSRSLTTASNASGIRISNNQLPVTNSRSKLGKSSSLHAQQIGDRNISSGGSGNSSHAHTPSYRHPNSTRHTLHSSDMKNVWDSNSRSLMPNLNSGNSNRPSPKKQNEISTV